MKQQIRYGTFETNSSSVHAISIFTNFYKSINNDAQHMEIVPGQFGWESECYTSTYSKLQYLYTAYLEMHEYKYYESDRELLDWFIPTVKTICNKYNLTIEFKETDDYYYIDHVEDLIGLFEDFRKDNSLLEAFLFNPESEILTGNDNSDDIPQCSRNANYCYEKTN